MFSLLDCFAILAGFAIARGKDQLPNPGRDALILLAMAVGMATITYACSALEGGIVAVAALGASFAVGYGYGYKSKQVVEPSMAAQPVENTI